MALPWRSIVRKPEFDEQLDALLVNVEEADEFLAAAEETLALIPEIGTAVSADRTIWYLPMQPVRGRRVSLFYTFDESTVIFLWIVAHDD